MVFRGIKTPKGLITLAVCAVALFILLPLFRFGDVSEYTAADLGLDEGQQITFIRIDEIPVKRGIYTMEFRYSSPDDSIISVHTEGVRVKNTYHYVPPGEDALYSHYLYVDSLDGVIAVGLENGYDSLQPVSFQLRYRLFLSLGYWLEHVFAPLALIILAVWLCFAEWIRAVTFRGLYFLPAGIMTLFSFLCRGMRYTANVSWSEYVKAYPMDTVYALLFYYFCFLSAAVLFDYGLKRLLSFPAGTGETAVGGAQEHPPRFARLYSLFFKYPFRTCSVTLLLSWIVCILVSYPGIFMNDTPRQISEALGNSPLANAHPVMHTLLYRLWLNIGNFFVSYNFGFYLFFLCQVAVMICVCAFSISVMIRAGNVPPAVWGSTLLFYALHPRIQPYIMLGTKDVIYSAFVLLFTISLFLIRSKGWHRDTVIPFLLGMAGTVMFRHEGLFLIVLSLALIPVHKIYRRILPAGIAAGFLILICFPVFVFTYFGSIMNIFMTIPFQQTARYVIYHPEDVSEEEKAAISGVLDYDMIPVSYDPDEADGIFKARQGVSGTPQDYANYVRALSSMLKKHPGVFLKGFLYNKSLCFLPRTMFYNNYVFDGGGTWVGIHNQYTYENSAHWMDVAMDLWKVDAVFSQPEALKDVREAYESARETYAALPFVELLASTFFYVWILFLAAFSVLKQKKTIRRHAFVVLMPLVAQLAIVLTGPCDGDFLRYSFPLVLATPAAVVYGGMLVGERLNQVQKAN